jgi:hypothetical protein
MTSFINTAATTFQQTVPDCKVRRPPALAALLLRRCAALLLLCVSSRSLMHAVVVNVPMHAMLW